MAKTRIEITGMESLRNKLESLPAHARGPIVKSAMMKAGHIIKKRISELAPQPGRPGYTKIAGKKRRSRNRLYETVTAKVIEYSSVTFVGNLLVIRPEGKDQAYHRHLIEHGHRMVTHGTMRHITTGKVLRSRARTEELRAKRTGAGRLHAGTSHVAARPFIEPAFRDTQAQAMTIIEDGIRKSVANWLLSNAMR